MTIRHHPADETLARFAAGTLGAGPALVIETHLAGCARCCDQAARFTVAAAAMTLNLEPVGMSDGALPRALLAIDAAQDPQSYEAALPRRPRRWPPGVSVPSALRSRDIGRWIWLAPRVRISRVAVPEDPRSSVILLWVGPGTALPEHGHSGMEYTQVLAGSYHDAMDTYRPGDLLEAGSEVEHRPVVDTVSDCVCIAAVEGPVRFRGWLGRILQPFVSPRASST